MLKSRKKNHILPHKWLFWWVFNFRFLLEDAKCAENEVSELLFHVQIVTQDIYVLRLKKKLPPQLNGPSGSFTYFLSVGSPFIEEAGKMP